MRLYIPNLKNLQPILTDIKIDYESVTVPASPPCPHYNGWYNSIPGRFWGRRRVFVCTDCGDILKAENKKEEV